MLKRKISTVLCVIVCEEFKRKFPVVNDIQTIVLI